jgi:outer membrane receptor protein involved in Fe transport
MSVYGEVTWHASDSLHITGGIRWFDNELSNVTAWSFPLFVGVDVPFVPYPTQQEDDVQLKLNVAYDLGEDTMGYFTYSEGFRRGGSNAIPATGYFAEPNPTSVDAYYADTVQNYEIGIKGTTDRIRYSADIYFIDWKDPQLNTATAFWSFFMAQNGTSAETRGYELEAQFALTDGLDLNLGYGYAKGELTADLLAPQFGNVIATKGHRLPGTAETTLTASMTHSMEVANGLTLSTRIGGYYQSDSINSVTETDVQETFSGFSMWNLSMTLGNENWSASLFAKNITNEQGTTASIPEAFTGIDSGTFENFYANTSRRYIVSPQTIGLALKYNF